MRFKDVFSIIGPSMIGPSSSHTAGAARLGRVARHLTGACPESAEITFYGSFADTYKGHGTDLAMIGGLLDFDTDDLRISTAGDWAAAAGMTIHFKQAKGMTPHPNTAKIIVSACGRKTAVEGASIGGGNIEVFRLDGFDVKFSGMFPTVVLYHEDHPGVIAAVSRLYLDFGLNISHMMVDRKSRSGEAMTVLEADIPIPDDLLAGLSNLRFVHDVRIIDLREG